MLPRLVILAYVAVTWAAPHHEPEPQCYSRFDYEYKVVQKLVDLGNDQKEQKVANAAQSDKIKAIEAEMETMKLTSEEKLQTLEKVHREQTETIKELRAVLDEVKSQNEILVEKMKEKQTENKGQIIAFSAGLSALNNIHSGLVIVFDHMILNEGDGYDVTSGKFTCPHSGVYLITFVIGVRDHNQGEFVASLMINGDRVVEAEAEAEHSQQDLQGGNSVVVKLDKDDEVWIQQQDGTNLGSWNNFRASSFSGVLLYPG